MFYKAIFLISESMKGLLRAKLPAVISSITISIALVFFSLSYFTYYNLLDYTHKFKSKYQIEVFFDGTIEVDEAKDLFNSILIFDGIEQGEFINKDKAAQLFQDYFNENILDIIGENPLPMGGKYDISLTHRNARTMSNIVADIRRMDGVDVASFQQGVISKVDYIVDNILGISMVLGFIIFITAIILVTNTIRLIIYSKQHDIETMHLLGASNLFIRIPFLLEGTMQGLLGSILSLLILYSFYSLQNYLLESLLRLPFIIPQNIVLYNFIFGISLALIGSLRGISKYLPK